MTHRKKISGIGSNLMLLGVALVAWLALKPKPAVTVTMPPTGTTDTPPTLPPSLPPTPTQRGLLTKWESSSKDTTDQQAEVINAFNAMSDQEISDSYNYVFNYLVNGNRPPASDPLSQAIFLISYKYGIFV